MKSANDSHHNGIAYFLKTRQFTDLIFSMKTTLKTHNSKVNDAINMISESGKVHSLRIEVLNMILLVAYV